MRESNTLQHVVGFERPVVGMQVSVLRCRDGVVVARVTENRENLFLSCLSVFPSVTTRRHTGRLNCHLADSLMAVARSRCLEWCGNRLPLSGSHEHPTLPFWCCDSYNSFFVFRLLMPNFVHKEKEKHVWRVCSSSYLIVKYARCLFCAHLLAHRWATWHLVFETVASSCISVRQQSFPDQGHRWVFNKMLNQINQALTEQAFNKLNLIPR